MAMESKQQINGNFTHMRCAGQTVLVCQNQTLETYHLEQNQLTLKFTKDIGSQISATCINTQQKIAYVALLDAPLYSLIVVCLKTGTVKTRRCLAQYLDINNMKQFVKENEVQSDREQVKINQEYECNAC